MIGLQATKLYLQTEEAYFSVVFFSFFSSILLFWYFSPTLYLRFFLKMLLLNSTGSDEIMHHSFAHNCSIQ